MLNINANRSAVGFGKVVEVKKVIIGSTETHDPEQIKNATFNLVDILLKNTVNSNGNLIRERYASKDPDYIIPDRVINRENNGKNMKQAIDSGELPLDRPLLGNAFVENKRYILTGQDSLEVYKATIDVSTALSKIQSQKKTKKSQVLQNQQKIEALGQKINAKMQKVVTNPDSKIGRNTGVTVYAQEIDKAGAKKLQVTGIDFTA